MNNEIHFPRKMTSKQLWDLKSEEEKAEILANTWCVKCHVTTMKDFKVTVAKKCVVLKGKCSKCGGNVAREVEE